MPTIIAIDPGNTRSAYTIWDGDKVLDKGLIPNHEMFEVLNTNKLTVDKLVIEMITSYGMKVGYTIFDTCVWIGRFMQYWQVVSRKECATVPRREVKLYLTHTTRSKDSNVIKAIKERYGPPGTKRNPNKITYGMKKDIWQAFALAIYSVDNYKNLSNKLDLGA